MQKSSNIEYFTAINGGANLPETSSYWTEQNKATLDDVKVTGEFRESQGRCPHCGRSDAVARDLFPNKKE